MNDAVGMVNDRQDRPAWVRFERRPVEIKQESIRQGKYVAKDVDFVLITPPYSKDVIEKKVETWLSDNDRYVRDGRLPQAWAQQYCKQYEAWRNGQELPPNGTPIRGWGMISPAQQEMLIQMGILTIEDLALVNDEGQKRIGMGSLDMKNKAKGWLSQNADKGPLTQEIACVKSENAVLKGSVDALMAQVKALQAMMPQQPQVFVQSVPEPPVAFSAEDLGLMETPTPVHPLPIIVPPLEEKPKRKRLVKAVVPEPAPEFQEI